MKIEDIKVKRILDSSERATKYNRLREILRSLKPAIELWKKE